jgi:hypothetical protein
LLSILSFFGAGPKTSLLVVVDLPANTEVSMLVGEHLQALKQFVLAQGRWQAIHPPAKTPFSRQHKSFLA